MPGGSTCARTAERDVVCWGWGQQADAQPYPLPYNDAGNTAVSGVTFPITASIGRGGYDAVLAYIDPAGQVVVRGSPIDPQPPCSDLLP
jgi:hypothetical protein